MKTISDVNFLFSITEKKQRDATFTVVVPVTFAQTVDKVHLICSFTSQARVDTVSEMVSCQCERK